MSNNVKKDIGDERELVSLLKKGDEMAFCRLIQLYQAKLYRIAYGMTSDMNESLDIVQEVFIKVHKNIHKFREDSKLSTWLHRITVNQCFNWHRKWKRRFKWFHKPLDTDNPKDEFQLQKEVFNPESIYEQKELRKIIWKKIMTLPEDARVVFILKEVEGLSYDEIAETLKVKRGTVSSRLFYARKRLKKSLKNYLDRGHE